MRLLNSLLFCITSFCYAISPYIRDFEFDFLKVDTSKITENICETYADAFVDSTQKSYFFENCFHDGGDVGFLSLLDTTVALYISAINTERPSFAMTRNQQACEGPSLADLKTTGLPGTHQFSEVLIFELLRFYELDFIENNRDSFEFQLNETVRKMIARDDYCVDLEFTDGIIGPAKPPTRHENFARQVSHQRRRSWYTLQTFRFERQTAAFGSSSKPRGYYAVIARHS